MVRILVTAFVALVGLSFGSFLNVCLSRWPEGESILRPRSHCWSCNRTLAWWENVPLLSWIALGGRCRTCKVWIGWRYPLVELAVGSVWAVIGWQLVGEFQDTQSAIAPISFSLGFGILDALGMMLLSWMLVGLAALDAEHFWLADAVTLPGVALGIAYFAWLNELVAPASAFTTVFWMNIAKRLLVSGAAALLILLIRWLYKLIRHREGIGVGDAKLMAMLAAWLGLEGALLSFFLGVVLGTIVAIIVLAMPSQRADGKSLALKKLPLGTFLCIGGIVSSLCGQTIIAAYVRWAGF